jgi:hypothetical protein
MTETLAKSALVNGAENSELAQPLSAQTIYCGTNIYYWGTAEQNHLLLHGVRTWARYAREKTLAQSFWYFRFDTRGPHLFLLFATTVKAEPALRHYLETSIAEFLKNQPSTHPLSQEDIEKRHKECRGKAFNVADFEPGFAENNSFAAFRHDSTYYPLNFTSGMPLADALWHRLDDIAFWAIDQLEGSPAATAIRWLAAVDQALHRGGFAAEAYWRFHACTLLLPLRERLAANEAEVIEMVPRLVSENNRKVFSAAWEQVAHENCLKVDVEGLVAFIMHDTGRTQEQLFLILREINHGVMAQLGQWVKFQIPVIVYAWSRNLPQ